MLSRTVPLLHDLRERGYIANVSDEDGLAAALQGGPLTLYCGFDATAASLHVGHLLSIMLLAHFQRAGHRPIVVVGGGTTMIGDPSGKTTARALLPVDEIHRNLAGIQTQFARFLHFGDDAARMVNNADWLLELRYVEFLRDIGRHFTVNQLLQHETYRQRVEQDSLSVIELNYALIQAYDFLHLNRAFGCRLQVGGNDQWFNILAGVELIRRAGGGGNPAFALTTPLLTTGSGQKMGKTESGAVWLDAGLTTPYDFFQYWRNVEDDRVGQLLRLFTFLPLDEVARLERLSGAGVNEAKEVLAFETTRLAHGDEEAARARDTARARFRGDGEDSGPSVRLDGPTPLVDLLVRVGLAESRSDAKRLIRGGGVRLGGEVQAGDRVIEPDEAPTLLSAGRARRVRVVRDDG